MITSKFLSNFLTFSVEHHHVISGPSCPPTVSRKMHWNRTKSGDTAIQPCPEGSSGLAKWVCGSEFENSASWTGFQPDLGDCKSQALSDLEVRVRKEDPEHVIVSKLVQLTNPGSSSARDLYGGDVESALNVLHDVGNRLQYKLKSQPDMYNKESHVQQILQNVLRVLDNLLSPENRFVWEDLVLSRRLKLASDLMEVLEFHSFLFADLIKQPEVIIEETKQISKYSL